MGKNLGRDPPETEKTYTKNIFQQPENKIVDKIVEKIVRKCNKVENFIYLCSTCV